MQRLRDTIKAAGFSAIDQERCVAYLQPGSQHNNLADLEQAQAGYQELRATLAKTMPYDEWLSCKPRHAKPADYGRSIGAVEEGARELVAAFGLAAVVRPMLSEQRQRPH